MNGYLFTDCLASISSFLLPNSIQFFFRYPPPLCPWIFYSSGKVDLTCSSRNGLSSLSQVVKFISQAPVIYSFWNRIWPKTMNLRILAWNVLTSTRTRRQYLLSRSIISHHYHHLFLTIFPNWGVIYSRNCVSKFTTVSHKSSINKPIGNAVTLQNCVPNKKQKTVVAFGEIKKLTPFKKTSKMEMTYLGGKWLAEDGKEL